jgi:hypothetical protein
MAYLVFKNYFNRDLATYAGEFAGRDQDDIDSDYQDVMYTIFDYFHNSHYMNDTPFEICRKRRVRGWVKHAELLLKFWKSVQSMYMCNIESPRYDVLYELVDQQFESLVLKGMPRSVLGAIVVSVAHNTVENE